MDLLWVRGAGLGGRDLPKGSKYLYSICIVLLRISHTIFLGSDLDSHLLESFCPQYGYMCATEYAGPRELDNRIREPTVIYSHMAWQGHLKLRLAD